MLKVHLRMLPSNPEQVCFCLHVLASLFIPGPTYQNLTLLLGETFGPSQTSKAKMVVSEAFDDVNFTSYAELDLLCSVV